MHTVSFPHSAPPQSRSARNLIRAVVLVMLILFALLLLSGCAGVNNGSSGSHGGGGTSVPAISSFGANPSTITSGNSTTLSWSTSGATSLAITPGTFTSTQASGSTSVSPTATTTYTLTATNSAGSSTQQITITVNPASSKPTINSFGANPTTINSGSSSTLSWSVTGATSIAITPGSFTSTNATGSTSVSPTSTTTYTLTATNSSGSVTSTTTVTVNASGPSKPTINSFAANPTTINSGSSSSLSWSVTGATSIAITPGSFTSTSATGSTSVSPTATTTYTLTATNSSGSTTATAKVTVSSGSSGGALTINTSSCPGGTQGSAYAGCTISVSGGTTPYTFSIDTSGNFAPLPEGLALNASTGAITSSLIGGQGTYGTNFIVTDAAHTQVTQEITFSINGNNAFLANVFPSTSIFHHRVDAATTSLPVDTSPAAAIYSGYLSATVKPFFGNDGPFPNGIPAIEVPADQADVSVSTTVYQSYFTSGPIPPYAPVEGTAFSTGDRHVLVYLEPGATSKPALYEMWQGIYENGPWTDSSNALWPDVSGNNLTAQGNGTSDAAGLPVAPLLANADEVIGSGSPTAPNGTVQHPIRFTVNHMLNYWVWPATETAGVGSCMQGGSTIGTESQISQSAPPSSCTMTGPAGEIYRLKASVATPTCAATSPQAAILITAFRNYGIILADNGDSGGLIGTPDARWNDTDLSCIRSLTLADFEPVNVSSLIVSNDSGATAH